MFVASAGEEPLEQDWQSEEGQGLRSAVVRRLRSWRSQMVCVSRFAAATHSGLASVDMAILVVRKSGPGWTCPVG